MRFYLRWPFIAALFAISIVMALFASVPEFELVDRYEITVEVEPGNTDRIILLNSTGIVKVTGDIPPGVKVYMLMPSDYWDYVDKGKLPGEFLGEGGQQELVAEDPFCLLIQATVTEQVSFKLDVEVYKQYYSYALLAVPAYILSIMALMLLFVKLASLLKEEQGVGKNRNNISKVLKPTLRPQRLPS